MIYVTVGTHPLGFSRLLRQVDNLCLSERDLVDKLVVQRGHSSPVASFKQQFDFVSASEHEEHLKRADLVISHAGVGSVMAALALGKPIIACPRYAHLDEHVDDHQVEWCREIEQKGWILCLWKGMDLAELVSASVGFKSKYTPGRLLQKYLLESSLSPFNTGSLT